MNVASDLSGVIASGMCIGCGACEMADGSVRVHLNPRTLIYEVIDEAVPAKLKEYLEGEEPNYAGLMNWVNVTFPLGLNKERAQFESATRTKLVLEIALAPLYPQDQTSLVHLAQQRQPRVNCLVGESLWRNRWGNN